ncbi:helix-turn-helix domain-containing protein [Flavivirga jejuensis]|uniref:AraC family transcriptional regulator n=1 Tax=Flavivirga jejuensis TaxID=870487 RepID=A0ABT8WSN7_9FLAO|nr:AraC family transcriptional regulator [Flavivirga jejuensis]MDO5976124.1 AraC family transcriptional regulator [Flavivirga jejuensis]
MGDKKSKFTVKTNNGDEIRNELNIDLEKNSFLETKEIIQTDFFKSEYKEILLKGASLVLRDSTITPPVNIDIDYPFPFIKVHFELQGSMFYASEHHEEDVVFVDSGRYNFFYLPKVKGTITLKKSKVRSLEIVVTEQFLRDTFKSNFNKISNRFGRALQENVFFVMFKKSPFIPSYLLVIANDIIKCSFEKEIKEVYIESKIKEVFSYIFTQLNQLQEPVDELFSISVNDRQMIVDVEKILVENLAEYLTIDKLAKMSGVNKSKLKKNFKIVTGKTIFTYLTDLRMKKASDLLLQNDMSISEVAYAVGYKYPKHFTVAFKRKFNYLPSELKKH